MANNSLTHAKRTNERAHTRCAERYKRTMISFGPLNTNENDIIKFIGKFFFRSFSLSFFHAVRNIWLLRMGVCADATPFNKSFNFKLGTKSKSNRTRLPKYWVFSLSLAVSFDSIIFLNCFKCPTMSGKKNFCHFDLSEWLLNER